MNFLELAINVTVAVVIVFMTMKFVALLSMGK